MESNQNKSFWIAVISKDHSEIGVENNILQVCHGKKGPLSRMKKKISFLYIHQKFHYTQMKSIKE